MSSASWVNVPLDSGGNAALVAGYIYTFRLTVPSTGTNTGATYQVYQTAASTWVARLVANNGTDSNKPRLQVSSGVVKVSTNNVNPYSVSITVETRATGNVTLVNPAVLGIDGVLSHDGDASALSTSARFVSVGAAASAWGSQNYGAEFQGGAVISQSTGVMQVAQNAVLTASGWVYKYNTYAALYSVYGGWHYWNTAASGTAGSAISWSSPMSLSYAGNLLIGYTADNGTDKLQVNGTVYHTSPANLDNSNKSANTAWVNANALCWYNNAATDFNAMLTSGVSFTSATTNNPTGVSGGILLVENSGGIIAQQFYTITSNTVYTRSSANGGSTWTAWKQVATTASPTFTGTTTTAALSTTGLISASAGYIALYGPASLPALSTSMLAGEITGCLNQSTDYGVLRLSAGGSLTLIQKTAIDLVGYTGGTDGRQIVFYTAGVRAGSFSANGNLLLNTTTDNGTDKLQVNGRIYSASGIGIAAYYDTVPALSSSLVTGEITGNPNASVGSYTADYGFLRLSAGGGTTLAQKAAIDLQGYGATDGSQIRFYANGTECMRIRVGRVLIGTTTDNGTDKLQVNGSAATSAVRFAASNPTAPAAGSALTYGQTIAGRTLDANLPSMGQRAISQVAQWDRKIGGWISGNVDSSGVFSGNFPSQTRVGTATPRTVTAGTMVGMATRLGYASATTAGSLSGTYTATAQYALGNGSYGGFQFTWRLNFSDPAAVSGARAFVGMSSNVSPPTNVEANTLTNSIGLAQLSTDATQLYIVYGGSAAQTAIALGIGFPPMASTGITGGPIYDFTLYSPSSANGVVYYRLERRDTGTFVEGAVGPGTAGTTLPANTTLLAPRAWRCNNATALAVGLDMHSMYSETEF